MKKTLVMTMAAVLTGSMAYPSLAEEYVFEMAPVVVTANRMNENLVDARADISVVTSRQIEKLHLNTVEDALRTVPGTQYLNYGGNGLNANLSGIRINGSKDIILLVDGVRVTDFNGANNSGYMYSSLLNNMDNVERIEVLRGSAGALYGSGAKGGVINIITKNPGEKKTTVDIARGTGGREMYKLTTMGRVGKFSYMAYYDKLLIGDTKSGDGRLWPGHTHTLSDGVKFAYDVTDKHSLSLSYDKMKSRYRGYDFVYSNRYHGDYKSDMLTLQDKISIGKHWDNQFTYRRNKVKTNYFQDYDMNAQSNWGISSDYTYDIIGRLGIAAGRATEKGNLYAKASILHEFKGDTAATFSAEGEDTSRVEQDFGDTWAELTLGGVYRLNGSNLFYANVTRGFGGDYKVEWKVNAGLRFAF